MSYRKHFAYVAAICIFIGSSWSSLEAACDTRQVVEVNIQNMRYIPNHISICRGQTIRWTNREVSVGGRLPMTHSVTMNRSLVSNPANVDYPEGAEEFDSGPVRGGQTFEHRFDIPGLYRYFCRPHEAMGHVGTIEVVED